MASEIFSGFSGFANVGKFAVYLGYGIVGLIVCLVITFAIVMLVAKSKECQIYVLDLVTRKFTMMSGREKKTRSGKRHIYIGRLKRFLPQIQSEDKYLRGKKEVILLIKDNNGLYHTARLPAIDEVRLWAKVMYNEDVKAMADAPAEQDITKFKESKDNLIKDLKNRKDDPRILKVLNTIYLTPNPAEDLDWLAGQAIEAEHSFPTEWWKNPIVLTGATIAMCIFLVIITMIIQKKM
jgi:hypothetical protein